MIPILYESNETSFTTMGLGALGEAISARVRRVLNGKDELELTYPTNGIRFNDLQNDRIIMAQPEYKKDAQPYRIYQITRPLNGSVKVYARHISEQKNFIPVMPFTASSLAETFTRLPSYVAESCPFTFWTNKSVSSTFSVQEPVSLGAVLGGADGSVLDIFGGEYEFDRYTIKLWNRRGADNGVSIRYGKNLTRLEQNESIDATITGICPFWHDINNGIIVTLPEKVIESDYADIYAYRRTVPKDFSDMFNEQPSEAELRQAAESYVEGAGIGVPKISMSVSFEHLAQYAGYENIASLETVNLGDTVHVEYEVANVSVSARVIESDYDVRLEKYNSVKIGSIKSSLTQTMREINTSVKEVQKEFSGIGDVIDAAVQANSDLITGVHGGYIRVNRDANGEPYEVLIMSTPDIATPNQNVIRINKNGIGFSTNGYAGPYRTAWTIDGHFTANFIDTGLLTANILRAGAIADIVGKNYWDLETGVFTSSTMDQKFALVNGSISTMSTQITELDNGIEQRIGSYINQDPKGWTARIDSLDTSVDGVQTVLNTYFVFDPNGLKITGTRGSAENSYLQLASDEVGLYVDGSKRLWLTEEGANADYFNANEGVSIGDYIWERYSNGIRLRVK